MAGRSDAAVGMVAVGVLLAIVGVARQTWWLLLPAICLIVGAVAATARARRPGVEPEVTLRPGGDGRPWRRTSDQ
ncbi:hypothetical protein [Streptomyces achromogenes]|uniref:hypothetical protein n=1 Tax=Streptomyces achromogenes TaxID=67255 RepID=UPI003A802B9B